MEKNRRWHYQTSWNEGKNKKIVPLKKEKTSQNQGVQQKSHQRDVQIVRYSGLFFEWTWEKLRQMDQTRRKLMIMHKAFHLRDDIDSMYEEKRRRLASIEDCIGTSKEGIEDCLKKG